MRILITGGSGTMAQALKAHWPDAETLSHQECDVTDFTAVVRSFHSYAPDVVIHAAAVTDHQCPDISRVFRTNVLGTRNVLRAAQAVCAEPVYLSTHYVYGGEAPPGGYRENAECDPIGMYAWSKYLGELAAHEYGALVVRGSWYTPEKLTKWLIDGAVQDAWCSRTDVASASSQIANLVNHKASGVYNIGGPRRTFHEIVSDWRCHPVTRADLSLRLPYTFPKDSSVNTDKYNALVQSGSV